MAGVNTADQRLADILNQKNQFMNEAQSNYDRAYGESKSKYNELIQAAKDYGQQQADIQQQKTDQTIAEINQNKEKTQRDYLKEQRGAYSDYAKQTNEFGTNAEQMAAAGLTGSGYQETSRVSMYNAYQNRIATARQSFNDATVAYDNQITQAQIANSAALAEIAYNSLQTSLNLSIQSIQYGNELLNNLLQQKVSIGTSYDQLWQSMYNTLLSESQFNEQMAYQKQRDAVEDSHWQQQFNLQKKTASARSSSSSKKKSSSKSSGSSGLKVNTSDDSQTADKHVQDTVSNWSTDDVQSILHYTNPNDPVRQGLLQRLVEANKLSQEEANRILSAK